MIKFFNTLSGKIDSFSPIKEGYVGLYTCGPTVYDYAHIGNFRSYVFEDILKRFLLYQGYQVTHVMNITDIDDKTISGAQKNGVSLSEYTRDYIEAFFRDIDALNIIRANHYPRATEHIPEMSLMIQGLLEKGFAYKKDGSIYYDISKFPEYGKLAKIDTSQLKKGKRVESDEYEKTSAIDFALWKAKKEGEPFWETEVGTGRPGWHIECSAMSSKYLGQTFDIHCGGIDNIFPHHENEIAQSEAFSGKKFVNTWLHCHHLIVDGEKMSKSKGNYYILKDLIDRGLNPMTIRFLLFSTHYRKQLNFTFEALDQADSSVKRFRDFQYELRHRSFPEGENKDVVLLIKETLARFSSALSDDLNISVALTAAFDMIKRTNILIMKDKVSPKDAVLLMDALDQIDKVLGILPKEEPSNVEERIKQKISLREKARAEKNFGLADQIRDELLEEGIILEDTKDGVRWKKK